MPWPMMWKTALLKAPTAHWTTMNDIWPTVDQASEPFTSERIALVLGGDVGSWPYRV